MTNQWLELDPEDINRVVKEKGMTLGELHADIVLGNASEEIMKKLLFKEKEKKGHYVRCRKCNGNGWLNIPDNGKHVWDTEECDNCGGSGQVYKDENKWK